jgi:hypothetical protein
MLLKIFWFNKGTEVHLCTLGLIEVLVANLLIHMVESVANLYIYFCLICIRILEVINDYTCVMQMAASSGSEG